MTVPILAALAVACVALGALLGATWQRRRRPVEDSAAARAPVTTADTGHAGASGADAESGAQSNGAATTAALRSQISDLQRSNRHLTEFAHVASHDLAEPLRAVSGYVQLLARRYDGELDEKAQRWIGFAVEGVERMEALIRDLLRFARIGGAEPELEPVDCNELAGEIVAELNETVTAVGAEITVEPLPTVNGDRGQLWQLLENLIGNAVKYRAADRPCRVHVSAQADPGVWRLEVSDNGIGIPEEHHERIFRMFQRLHVREEYAGTGIGLAIAARVAEAHGGELRVEDGPEGGARFVWTLPRDEALATIGAMDETA